MRNVNNSCYTKYSWRTLLGINTYGSHNRRCALFVVIAVVALVSFPLQSLYREHTIQVAVQRCGGTVAFSETAFPLFAVRLNSIVFSGSQSMARDIAGLSISYPEIKFTKNIVINNSKEAAEIADAFMGAMRVRSMYVYQSSLLTCDCVTLDRCISRLEFVGCIIGDDCIDALSKVWQVDTLIMRECNVSGRTYKALSCWSGVSVIDLRFANGEIADFEMVLSNPTLTTLIVPRGSMSHDDLVQMRLRHANVTIQFGD